MKAEMAPVRASTTEAFGVNVFVPGEPTAQAAESNSYVESLAGEAAALGVTLGDPSWDDDGWAAKITALLNDSPPVVSFTFGCPPAELVSAFHETGTLVVVTVTAAHEALMARCRRGGLLVRAGHRGRSASWHVRQRRQRDRR